MGDRTSMKIASVQESVHQGVHKVRQRAPKVAKSAQKEGKGLQKGPKMEARYPPERTLKGFLAENSETYEKHTIY